MTALPRLYARFLPIFAKMDLPLRNALEGMLTAFAKVPPPYAADERQPQGEFVGYDGIENRGKLSNLLESEWLLRELDPDDFVRRVAESEVMFRRRDFKGTGTKDVLAVVLDCGPWMLGRNRIIALAALFYLALRADRLGAQLLWTVPGEAKGWSEDITPENIRIFLGRVVQKSLTAEVIDTTIATGDMLPKECWYVGATQSGHLIQHPDITGSILTNTPYGGDDAEVQISSRGRRSKVAITLPSDPDTVAALRRPFVPERKKAAAVAPARGGLSAVPFYHDWLLDRFNHGVLIRYPNGVLWKSLREMEKGVWLATRQGKTLLGVQPQPNGQIAVLNGISETEHELIELNVLKPSATISKRLEGRTHSPITGQLPNAMGNLFLGGGGDCFLVTADGTIHTITFDGPVREPDHNDTALLGTGVYLIEHNNSVLTINNPKRGTLARIKLPHQHENLLTDARSMVFSPDTKAIAFTTDEKEYTALVGLDVVNFELDDMKLLHFHSTNKAIGWSASDSSLVQFRIHNSKVIAEKVSACDCDTDSLPRYCPLTMTTFAMTTDDSGNPFMFLPLETTRGWENIGPFDISRAVEEVETLWL